MDPSWIYKFHTCSLWTSRNFSLLWGWSDDFQVSWMLDCKPKILSLILYDSFLVLIGSFLLLLRAFEIYALQVWRLEVKIFQANHLAKIKWKINLFVFLDKIVKKTAFIFWVSLHKMLYFIKFSKFS